MAHELCDFMDLVREVEIFAEKIDVVTNYLKTAAVRGTRHLNKTLPPNSDCWVKPWFDCPNCDALLTVLTYLTYLLTYSMVQSPS